jgi:hypothetical protein
MKFAIALALIVFCTPAHAADPWKPVLDLFRPKPAPMAPPITVSPYHPSPDTATEAIERALLDAELQAAIKRANEAAEKAEEAAKAAEVRDAKSPLPPPKPKAKTTAKPLDIRPKVTSSQCAQIGIGIGLIGKDGVKREAIARGHSATEIDEVQKACGF